MEVVVSNAHALPRFTEGTFLLNRPNVFVVKPRKMLERMNLLRWSPKGSLCPPLDMLLLNIADDAALGAESLGVAIRALYFIYLVEEKLPTVTEALCKRAWEEIRNGGRAAINRFNALSPPPCFCTLIDTFGREISLDASVGAFVVFYLRLIAEQPASDLM